MYYHMVQGGPHWLSGMSDILQQFQYIRVKTLKPIVSHQHKIKMTKVVIDIELFTLLQHIVHGPSLINLTTKDWDQVAATSDLAYRDY